MAATSYEERLAQEAALWGQDAQDKARQFPPDWAYHRRLRDNAIMAAAHIDALLAQVQPGMAALELGCGSGWLALALARRGAQVTGVDISAAAIDIARAYYETVRDTVAGSVSYRVADLNTIVLPPEAHDLVVVKSTLHHLVALDHVIEQIHGTLKPGGLLWVMDASGEEAPLTVLIASGLMFVLPTAVSYREKLRGLLRFGFGAPSRIKASMEAEGLSPFEGAGREHDWLQRVYERFMVERRVDLPAFTGYITAQLRLPDRLALPLLRAMYRVDSFLVRRGALRNSGVVLYARKAARSGGG